MDAIYPRQASDPGSPPGVGIGLLSAVASRRGSAKEDRAHEATGTGSLSAWCLPALWRSSDREPGVRRRIQLVKQFIWWIQRRLQWWLQRWVEWRFQRRL